MATKKPTKAKVMRRKARLTTKSPLAKKYPKKDVARARDTVRAEEKVKVLRTPKEWAAVGEIAKLEAEKGKKISLYKIDAIAKRTKKSGKEPYYKKITKK